MLWFGGFVGPRSAARVPVASTPLWEQLSTCWSAGNWPTHEMRTAQLGRRTVAVIGPSGITTNELLGLARDGVPNDATWRWSGSYTVVSADDAGTSVWTDVGGACPIYIRSADDGTYWSSSSRGLAGLTNSRPDTDWLAAWLLAPGLPDLLSEWSAFGGIALVPPGSRVDLASGRMPDIRRVWRPRRRSGDHSTRLRCELDAAVAVRVDSATVPTVDLSGGYDSTALALLAANRVQPDRTVTAVTLHPDGVTAGGDVSYARRAAEYPGIHHRLLPLGPQHTPYSDLHVPVTDEPAPSTIVHSHFSAQLRWMKTELDSDCHMTGDGGDSLLCSPPIMLADLMAAGRHRRALAEAVAWARLRRVGVLPLVLDAYRTAHTTFPVALRAWARQLLAEQQGIHLRCGWAPGGPPPPWCTEDARHRAADIAMATADRAEPAPHAGAATRVTTAIMARVGRTAHADVQLAGAYGVPLHNPFTDSRLIDSYLSIPLDDRPGPADYKPILRAALTDVFPTALANRRTKGSFTADFYQGMRANLPTLLDLADGRLAELGLVNAAELRTTLKNVSVGVPLAFSAVEPAIAAEAWLRSVDAAPSVRWTPARQRQGAA
jgi:asparagine synthase (glutamine-hydrolysing)